MEKCRTCLKYSKNVRSLYDTEDGISFHYILTYFTNLNTHSEVNIPENICLSCRKKLRQAYTFKIDVEMSEMVLNESVFYKRIKFNNIHDIDIKIDYKPLISPENYFEDLFRDDAKTVAYNDTVITRIKENINDGLENQMSVKEFLNSVKMESDDGYSDQEYIVETDYDSDNYNDYKNEKILTVSKKGNRNYNKKSKAEKNTTNKARKESVLEKPIKPVYIKDVQIEHTVRIKDIHKPKKNYKYPRKTSVCPHCGKLLISKYINLHILGHTGVRSYTCNECMKSFVTENQLNCHKKKHTASRTYKCNQCVASFIDKISLKSHMAVHSDVKQFTCEICSKGFKRKCALRRHLLIHNFGKKSIPCELCPMSFHTNSALKAHMRIHTGERPYKCELCSQPYSYKHDFNRHCFKKHGVFLKQRSVYVMNEEVLQQEKSLMRELALKVHSGLKDDNMPQAFINPRGALAFNHAMKAIEAQQIPII